MHLQPMVACLRHHWFRFRLCEKAEGDLSAAMVAVAWLPDGQLQALSLSATGPDGEHLL